MTYILLVAGKGTRLHPLTMTYPKCLFKLSKDTTVIKRMVRLIKKHDNAAEIVVVTGFKGDVIQRELGSEVTYIYNPFYSVTNSVASLWFAREYLNRDQVTVINGDIVMSKAAIADVLCVKHDKPLILLDSSIKSEGDYNVQVDGEFVVVMSKNLKNYYGEYAGVTILTGDVRAEISIVMDEMLREEQYDEWYENLLVRMIFRNNCHFHYCDICDYDWTEIDHVDDLVKAKRIHNV